jgi:hypothetical protein
MKDLGRVTIHVAWYAVKVLSRPLGIGERDPSVGHSGGRAGHGMTTPLIAVALDLERVFGGWTRRRVLCGLADRDSRSNGWPGSLHGGTTGREWRCGVRVCPSALYSSAA